MVKVRFEISQWTKGIEGAAVKMYRGARRGVDEFGEHVIGDAQQLTPVDTGTLQGSGTTWPAEVRGGRISKRIGFNTTYAGVVHEDLNVDHAAAMRKRIERQARKRRKTAKARARFVEKALAGAHHVGQAKFLETAMIQNEPKLNDFIVLRIKQELAR